jgi:hypothetical protein
VRVPLLSGGFVLAASLALPAGPAAQAPSAPAPPTAQQDETHFQISVMEGVLQRAAEAGARQTSQRLMAISSEPLLWNGAARARGFRLDNYGFFFDVEVPALRGTVAWSIQVLDQSQTQAQAELLRTLQGLQQQIRAAVADRQAREQLDQSLRRLQVELIGDEPPAGDAGVRSARTGTIMPRPARPPVDPFEAYTTDVKNALIDAMLDHGAPLGLAPDEWLTVAARDNDSSGGVGPSQPYDLMTIILRIRGGDLIATQTAFHERRLSKDEARKKVEVREF